MPLIVIPIPILLAFTIAIPFPLIPIPISQPIPLSQFRSLSHSRSRSRSRVSINLSNSFVVFSHRSKSLVADGPRGIYCVIESEGGDTALDAGRALVGGALGDVDVDIDTLPEMVEVELPLKFLPPGHDSINALRPFGGDLCIGFGATQLGLRLERGGVNGTVAIFIERGTVQGLFRAREGASIETEGEIACEEGTTGEAHLLPCPGGVPLPVNGGGGATVGRGGNCAMECAWRRLGRGGNTAGVGVGGSVLDTTGGGTEEGFEFEFVTAGDISLI
jgi:hypothetical protein